MRYHHHHGGSNSVWSIVKRKYMLIGIALLAGVFFAFNLFVIISQQYETNNNNGSNGKDAPHLKVVEPEVKSTPPPPNTVRPPVVQNPPPSNPNELKPPTFNDIEPRNDVEKVLSAIERAQNEVELTSDGQDLVTDPNNYHIAYKQLVETIPAQYHPSNFHVAIVTANRPTYLRATLRSLRQVLYWNKDNTVIYQYGNDERINQIAQDYDIKQVKNPVVAAIGGKAITEGAEHIAYHYKFVFETAFASDRNRRHVIVVEDDFLFAPDFLLYFSQTAPILDNDPTIYAISAYNDNGFMGKAFLDNMVYRTDFFIGLGWLVSRKHWTEEWATKWPRSHWDHFLRSPANRRNRQTIYPEVSRVYHSGYQGTHSTIAMYEQYFRDIVLNSHGYAPLGIDKNLYEQNRYGMQLQRSLPHTLDYLYNDKYLEFFEHLFNSEDPQTIYMQSPTDASTYRNKILVLFFEAPSETNNNIWLPISRYYDVWHTLPIRSGYRGAVMFRFNENWLIAVGTYSRFYTTYGSRGKLFREKDFADAPLPVIPHSKSILQIDVADKGVSCGQWCRTQYGETSKCDLFKISVLNNCLSLKQYMQCSSCGPNSGTDQPALDTTDNSCYYNTGSRKLSTTCEGSHFNTRRLCACVDPAQIKVFHEEWERIIAVSQKQATEPYGV